jgi:putative ABC transport system permease protein
MIGADGSPEMVSAQMVTAQFFDVLGVRPIAGRTFALEDETMSRAVVVMSEGFWRRRFAADPTLVGRDITLEAQPVTVIGIMPARFQFAPGLGFDSAVTSPSIWTLLPTPRQGSTGSARGQCAVCRLLQVVGRLKPGVSVEAARADLTAIAEALALRNGANSPRRVTVTLLRDVLIGRDLRLTSLLLLGVVGLTLLLCATNVANLVLARTTVRLRELAIRSTLGAGRRRIFGQLLTESLVLAALGGVLGLGVGAAILRAAPALIPAGLLPGAITLEFDGRVVMFCGVIALVVGGLFGFTAAYHVTGASLSRALASESRSATGRSGRTRRLIVVGEVAIAVVVLCSAGLLLRTLLVVDGFDPGYTAERERLLAIDFAVPALAPGSRYPTREALLQFYDAVEHEVSALPEVRSAAWASTLPLGGSQLGRQSFEIVGETPSRDGRRPQADYQIVSPGYFRTLALPIVSGRAFTERDTGDSIPVCIVNEAFARRYLQGRNPIGMRVSVEILSGSPVVREIVGVARQVKGRPDEVEELVQLYVPARQSPWPEAYLIVRAAEEDGTAMTPTIRRAISRVDKVLPVSNIMTLEQVARAATARHRFRAVIVGTFASLALVLAMVGVFGVLAYSVQQRTREFGVRVALGATTRNVLGLVLGGAARVIGIGLVIGLGLALTFAQAIATFLFGVQPRDLLTFVAATIVLTLTAAIAAAAPALRAARVDPVVAFRTD